MSKRRGGVVDSDESDYAENLELENDAIVTNGDDDEHGSSDEQVSTFNTRRNRLRNLNDAKIEVKNEDDVHNDQPMQWPVVLKTTGKARSAKREDDDDEEYADPETSDSEGLSGSGSDEEFEFDDGGFVVDSDDNVVPRYGGGGGSGSSSRRRKRRRTESSSQRRQQRRQQRSGRPPGRPRKRGSDVVLSDEEEEDDDFSVSEGSIEEELRDLRGENSPARPSRNYRTRAPVDYSIPPPPTIEEVAEATAKAAEAAAKVKVRDHRARRLFDVRGPFGGRDVHTLFNLTREDLEAVVKISKDSLDGSSVAGSIGGVSSVIANAAGAPGSFGNGTGGNGGGAAAGGASADIDPVDVTGDVDFSMVGGLDDYIAKLKEMISLPLLYPELYEKFGITPPRGVLFHGPPGTGKTLMARALAASHKQQKVTFYMRKGADVLSKWIGESERQLRALFDEARAHQPSIIFFDEIDGLAPVRSAKQEQHHASIVSTLLALMDGMDNRGQVVVIGATNRPDSVDPALRRPGRFDREFYFPLPDFESRRKILQIHTRKWQPPLSDEFLSSIARQTKGYGGADLRALTTEAALLAIQRAYPQIYSSEDKLVVDSSNIEVRPQEFTLALEHVQPSTARAAGTSLAQPLPSRVEPLLRNTFEAVSALVQTVFPVNTKEKQTAALFLNDKQFNLAQNTQAIAQSRVYRPRLLIEGLPGNGHSYLTKAIANMLEGVYVCELSLSSVFGASMGAVQPESAIVNAVSEARQRSPSCILLPTISEWETVPHLESLLAGLLRSLSPTENVFIVGSDDRVAVPEGESVLRAAFGTEVIEIKLDTRAQVLLEFFKPVLEFVLKTPNSCLEAQEMAPPPPPKLEVAPQQPDSNDSAAAGTAPAAAPTTSATSTVGGVFSESERAELRIRSQLKLKLGVILDGFRQRYRRFRKPVIDEEKLAPLFEKPEPPKENGHQNGATVDDADNHDDDDDDEEDPYVVTADRMILERSTGKRYYNMDLETVEDRLWNGFYCEPQQFLEDMEMIFRDATVSGERERMHKASEMLANAQVAIDDISMDKPFVAACKQLRAKDAASRLKELTEGVTDETAQKEPILEESRIPNGDSEHKNDDQDQNQNQNHDEQNHGDQNVSERPVLSAADINSSVRPGGVLSPLASILNPIENGPRPMAKVATEVPTTQSADSELRAAAPAAAITSSGAITAAIAPTVEDTEMIDDDRAIDLDPKIYQGLKEKLVETGQGLCLEQLEQLYAALADIAWQHRLDWDRNQMVFSMGSHITGIVQK